MQDGGWSRGGRRHRTLSLCLRASAAGLGLMRSTARTLRNPSVSTTAYAQMYDSQRPSSSAIHPGRAASMKAVIVRRRFRLGSRVSGRYIRKKWSRSSVFVRASRGRCRCRNHGRDGRVCVWRRLVWLCVCVRRLDGSRLHGRPDRWRHGKSNMAGLTILTDFESRRAWT